MAWDDPEFRPLLRSISPPSVPSSPSSPLHDHAARTRLDENVIAISDGRAEPTRAVEDDVLPETSTLGRTLSWQSAYVIVMSRVIGSGIFATPGSIVRSVGSPGLSLTLWLVGSVMAACGLAISLEFGTMLPRSGGDKVYLEFTYRRPRFLASTLVAVYVVLLGFTASNCVIFSQYVLFSLGYQDPSDALQKTLAAGLLTAIVFVHGVFPRAGVRVQNWLGWIKVAIVIAMILSGLYVVTGRSVGWVIPETGSEREGGLEWGTALSSWDQLWQGSNWNWGAISTSLFKVFYSYAGLDNANLVLNEVKDPVRSLRSVTFTALPTACGLYVLANVAYFIVIPVEEIKNSGELIAGLFFERTFGPSLGRTALSLAVALSAAGNVLVVVFAQARLKQEIARQGFLPFASILSSTKPFGSPLGGLLVHYIPSLLVIVLPPSREVYSFILEVEGYPAQFFALAIGIGLLWLRIKRPDLRRPFKAWRSAVVLKLLMSLALLAAPFFPPSDGQDGGFFYATYALVGVGILVTATLYWYVWTRLMPRLGGYRLEEKADVLEDGTTITKLVHVPK